MVSVQHQLLTLAVLALMTLASCAPKEKKRQGDLELRSPFHHHAIIWKKLLPILQVAFTNAITSVAVNWFYPNDVLQIDRTPAVPSKSSNYDNLPGYPPTGMSMTFSSINYRGGMSRRVKWFYPWRTVPYPPGKIGIAQLWGGYPKHPYYGRRRRSLHYPSLKAS